MSLGIGFLLTLIVIVFSLEGSTKDYVNTHSILLVIGGTFTIAIFSTPVGIMKSLWHTFVDAVKGDDSVKDFQDQLVKLAEDRSKDIQGHTHPMIAYAHELWAQGIDPDLFIVLLSQKRRELESKQNDAIHALKNLAKYPPVLGMTGTVMGMISLFSALDQNRDKIGSSLSAAMTATFFGLIVANGLLAPLADRLHVRHVRHVRVLENIYELLLLINQGEPVILIREELNERAA